MGFKDILHLASTHNSNKKQAGAELCQAQFKLGLDKIDLLLFNRKLILTSISK